jgi:class 3 adenylate cyclase
VRLKGFPLPVRPIDIRPSADETALNERDLEPPVAVETVMITDIVGSTELAAKLGDEEWWRSLDRYHSATHEQVAAFGGRVIDETGDGVCAVFDRPAKAVRVGLAILSSLRKYELAVGMGLHTGEVRVSSGKVSGIAVHIAARVSRLASANEVLATSTFAT